MKKVSSCCNVEHTLKVIGGKWKIIILWHLSQSTLRFSELERKIPGITQKMLTSSLRELENDRLVIRTVYPEVPPRVEYAISPHGISLNTVLKELDRWGDTYRSEAA